MKQGFIKVATATVNTVVADVAHNTAEICTAINNAQAQNVKLLILPELAVTGYTCGDLFFSSHLTDTVLSAIKEICDHTAGTDVITVFGAPLKYCSKLYNCAVCVQKGTVLGIAAKTYIPNRSELDENRYFASADTLPLDAVISVNGTEVPFGNNLIFTHKALTDYSFALEIGEDLWATSPINTNLCLAGAVILANLSASAETVGREDFRRNMLRTDSARLCCGYIYAGASMGESTQDLVFANHQLILENGKILNENLPFSEKDITVSEIDVELLANERRKNSSFIPQNQGYRQIYFDQQITDTILTRRYDANPFIPDNISNKEKRAETILNIQAYGLKKRISHTHTQKLVLGISGGLDSTLALLVAIRAVDLLGMSRKTIVAVTMPCFGTTNRTKSNAIKLCEELGVTLKEVNITNSVLLHFEDIGQDKNVTDVTYENSQARERTQVLMDIANMVNGLVIGTGDLSELALGWATYNGDHMSMYGVNASLPKTLIRFVVEYEAQRLGGKTQEILNNILCTPVSPELLPTDENGNISQKTEDLVGPYELHDFFLYNLVRYGFSPKKIYRLASYVFVGKYDTETIKHWLKTFIRRFFNQQFKRSCLPDGPKVGTVSLSPRGDFKMPSDAASRTWLSEAEQL